MTVQLYFGQGRAGEPAWRAFVAGVLSRALPDGFTVYDASGQWRDPATGRVSRERTKVVEAFLLDPASSQTAIDQVIAAYKRRFHQKSVGLLSAPSCGAF